MEEAAANAQLAVTRVSDAEAAARERVMRLLDQVEQQQQQQRHQGDLEEVDGDEWHGADGEVRTDQADPEPERGPWDAGYMDRLA